VTGDAQLSLPLALTDEPASPAGFVATLLGVSAERVHAAIDAGELPAWHEGRRWQVPLWAIPTYSRTLG